MLFIKRPYFRQPPRLLAPNLDHPQLRNCRGLWFFENPSRVINALDASVIDDVQTGSLARDLGIRNTSAVKVIIDANIHGTWRGGDMFQGEHLILARVLRATDNTSYVMGLGTSANYWFRLYTGSSRSKAEWDDDDRRQDVDFPRVPANEWVDLVARRSGDTYFAHLLSLDEPLTGSDFNSEPAYQGFTVNQDIAIPGDIPNLTGTCLAGNKIAFVALFDADIPEAQLRAVRNNPYAPFERRIWIPTGEAPPPVITGTGALQAQDASVSGTGDLIPTIEGTGALQAQPASVSGTGDLIPAIEGTGALQAQPADVSGVGAIVHDGAGVLQAQDAAVSGVGEVGNVRTGTGALQAGDATVASDGVLISVGTGALQAQSAAVSGVGQVEGLTTGTGALQAQEAAVSGLGEFTFSGSGALQAQAASVSGVGFLLGETTLSPADIAAIQNAVWSDPRAVQLLNQVNEIWQRRGLDSANPQTYDKAGKQIRVGGITIDLTGDANEVTQTRQP